MSRRSMWLMFVHILAVLTPAVTLACAGDEKPTCHCSATGPSSKTI
jgi:hypothetical protein